MVRSHAQLRLDVTPLIGVMLALLTVMMVAFPRTIAVPLDQMPYDCFDRCGKIHMAFINLTKSGLYLDSRLSSLDSLKHDLTADGVSTKRRLMVRADASVSYDDFMKLLNELHDDGYDNIGLISEEFD